MASHQVSAGGGKRRGSSDSDERIATAETSVRCALDDAQMGIEAVEKLLSATNTPTHSAAGNQVGDSDDARALRADEQVLLAILKAGRRDDAIEAMAQRLAFELPRSTIRIIRGRHRIKAVYDHRLGWLGSGNEIRDSLQDIYARVASVPIQSERRFVAYEDQWLLNLSDDQAATKLLVLIRMDPERTEGSFAGPAVEVEAEVCADADHSPELTTVPPPEWLLRSGQVWSVALYSRPTVSTLRRIDYVGQRPLMTLIATIVIVGLIALFPVRYPVNCVAGVQPLAARVVVSPFDARLLTAHVEPGDQVRSGTPLLSLDGRPLRMELESIEAEIQAIQKDEDVALAIGEVAEAQRAGLQREKLQHRRDLIHSRLTKLEISSPTDGIVIGGDLKRFEGSTVTLGQTLLEIAPMDEVRLELEIPEFEISMVPGEASARVRFASIGGPSFRGDVERILPSAELRDDRNVFIARMSTSNPEHRYRPGMKGEAVIDGPWRPLIWRYVRGGWEQVLWWAGY